MTQGVTVARPYAKALFKQAKQQQKLHHWLPILAMLSDAVNNDSMQAVLQSPYYQDEQRQSILLSVIEAVPELAEDFLVLIKDFIQVLTMSRRLAVLPDIHRLYVEQLEQHEGVVTAHVRSARPLLEWEVSSVKAYVEKTLRAKAHLELNVDVTLIGGVVVQVGSWVMDGSVSNRLARLSESLRG